MLYAVLLGERCERGRASHFVARRSSGGRHARAAPCVCVGGVFGCVCVRARRPAAVPQVSRRGPNAAVHRSVHRAAGGFSCASCVCGQPYDVVAGADVALTFVRLPRRGAAALQVSMLLLPDKYHGYYLHCKATYEVTAAQTRRWAVMARCGLVRSSPGPPAARGAVRRRGNGRSGAEHHGRGEQRAGWPVRLPARVCGAGTLSGLRVCLTVWLHSSPCVSQWFRGFPHARLPDVRVVPAASVPSAV